MDRHRDEDEMMMTTTPGKGGILRLPSTPGTGQSVRFGKRLYDDGDESRMSTSTASTSALSRSPIQILQEGEISEDAVEMSLGRISTTNLGTSYSDSSVEDEDGDSRERLQEVSHETVALPNLEGYSNLEDVSFEFGIREDTTAPTLTRPAKIATDSFDDVSFDESFLRAEIELAKKQMEREAGSGRENGIDTTIKEAETASSDPTLLLSNDDDGVEPTIETSRGEGEQGTPYGANTTQASEYMSTRSQASSQSPASTAPQWNTPQSSHLYP